MFRTTTLAAAVAFASSTVIAQGELAFPSPADDGGTSYEVTITNLTPGQTFTPQLLVTHPSSIALFEIGEPAIEELAILAEGGNTAPLAELAIGAGAYAVTIDGLLAPGASTSGTIDAVAGDVLSIAAMLIPTNDTFVALDGMPLPAEGTVTYYLKAYDAGSEKNDQLCRNIPGPVCGGEGVSAPAEDDEGFVHVSNGFHNLRGNALKPEDYDWRNPVAKVTVSAM
jgi:hypothetical protein